MSVSGRDRVILMLIVPIAVLAAYWFLLLAPKRQESQAIHNQLTVAQGERDTAAQRASQLVSAKRNFATDYAAVIRLGKSVPTSVDMPSLLVQLDTAARGTGITFVKVTAGQSTAPAVPVKAATATAPAPGSAAPAPGSAAPAPGSAAPVPGAAAPASGAPGTSVSAAQPALQSIPLDFAFNGSFFHLADFFHQMKRFVKVVNNKIIVNGRLMVINNFSFDVGQSFPTVKALVHATVYLSPQGQGVSAGASPQGPASAPVPASSAPPKAPSAPANSAATVTAR